MHHTHSGQRPPHHGPQNVKKSYKMNNRTEQLPSGRRGIGAGRTIVMTDGMHLAGEMLAADILGLRVHGWDYDQPNDTAYLYLEREAAGCPPGIHLVGREALRLGNWTERLAALDALGSSPMGAQPTLLQKLAAWFRGRRTQGTAPVQEGGAR